MKKTSVILSRIAILAGLCLGSFALAAAAGTWVAPTAPPPGNNVDAPLNAGSVLQEKAGGLWIHKGLSVDGNLIIATGTPIKGAFLTALDNFGTVGWTTTSAASTQDCNTASTGAITSGGGLDLTVIPLTINGKNICVSERGCYIDVWDTGTINTTRLYTDYFGSAALFRQGTWGGNDWFFSQTNRTGTNGNATASMLFDWWHDLRIYDDFVGSSNNYTAGGEAFTGNFAVINYQTYQLEFNESNPNYLTIANRGNNFFDISICRAANN